MARKTTPRKALRLSARQAERWNRALGVAKVRTNWGESKPASTQAAVVNVTWAKPADAKRNVQRTASGHCAYDSRHHCRFAGRAGLAGLGAWLCEWGRKEGVFGGGGGGRTVGGALGCWGRRTYGFVRAA